MRSKDFSGPQPVKERMREWYLERRFKLGFVFAESNLVA
jgi:hypothetical protein